MQSHRAGWSANYRTVLTHTHTYSGKADHGGRIMPPENYRQLNEWMLKQGIDAVGMGSPYTPRCAADYRRYDGPERDIYYAGQVNRANLAHWTEIPTMLREAAEQLPASAGPVLHYLDNETPKCRFGHLWWIGYVPDEAPWHDYDQDYDRWMCDAPPGFDGQPEPMAYNRRPYAQIVAAQRARGALGCWAHPTSWWFGPHGQFITNIASLMPAHLLADGYVDGMVIMGYHPWRPQYLDLWHLLLDEGFRVPGVAEMDVGLSSEETWRKQDVMLNALPAPPIGERLSLDHIRSCWSRGRIICTTGPGVDLQVDGVPMGSVTATSPQHVHHVELSVNPAPGQQRLGLVQLLSRQQQVVWSATGVEPGLHQITVSGSREPSYLTARAFGEGETVDPARFRQVRQIALSNPVYLHPERHGFVKPLITRLTLNVDGKSHWHGARIEFRQANGQSIERGLLRGSITIELPAAAHVRLTADDGRRHSLDLMDHNERLLAVQRYLYRGQFRKDFPNTEPGEVPTAAWKLESYRHAMLECRWDL